MHQIEIKTMKTKVIVGLGSCGIAAGASRTFEKVQQLLANPEFDFELERTSCIGMCYKEPLVEVRDQNGSVIYGDMTEDKVAEVLSRHLINHEIVHDNVVSASTFEGAEDYFFDGQVKIALRNCGLIDPESLEASEQAGAYQAINKIINNDLSPAKVIDMVSASGLR
ncbi:MAG: NAD(P)H-dependent oxidoreductase subunit E, partial [Bacteroidia bacterium]